MPSREIDRRRRRRDHRLLHLSLHLVPWTSTATLGQRAGGVEELEIRGERTAGPGRVQIENLTRGHDSGHVRSLRVGDRVVEISVCFRDVGWWAGEIGEVEELGGPRGSGDGGEFFGFHGEDCGGVGRSDPCVRVACAEGVDDYVDVRGDVRGDFGWWGWGPCPRVALRVCRFGGFEVIDVDLAGEDGAVRGAIGEVG